MIKHDLLCLSMPYKTKIWENSMTRNHTITENIRYTKLLTRLSTLSNLKRKEQSIQDSLARGFFFKKLMVSRMTRLLPSTMISVLW